MPQSKRDESGGETDQTQGSNQDDLTNAETAETSDTQAEGLELDFESLDLSVEAVDERISPSETNVFDK